jgi:hypothetical protein
MRRLTIIFVMALVMIKILTAHQSYEDFVRNSIYLVHSLDIATELLIKEQDIFYVQANTVELTGALCEVLGRLIMLNQLFSYELLFQSIHEDISFWSYMKERINCFIERLSESESDSLIQLIIVQLQLWNTILKVDLPSTIND